MMATSVQITQNYEENMDLEILEQKKSKKLKISGKVTD